ncbi:hypothetical protein TRAPUB_1218 [Trametes pubescens]|uniref:F-box domain-containing protein n=1 Tax=Trametes pubescens TaxID=154538 RepID=A0A1M2VJZ9_TRAPU|nr:hypothetical protein TRAPUB_1218 [Trametes pubescens]
MSSNDYNKSMWLGREIGGLRHLTYFEAPDIELLPEAVEHLASLPNLARIVIMTKPADHDRTRFPYTGERTSRFPSLVDAQIHTNCFVWCAVLISTISSPVLRKLLINNRSCPSSAPVLKVLLAAVGQLPAGPTLRELTIFSGDEQAPLAPGPTIVRAAAMRPLAALTALQRLHIGGWCEVLLDDATLAYLRLYFPHTPCGAAPFPVSRPLVTLQGLAVFARACPHLESVFIPVDARVVPEFEPAWGGRHLRRPAEVPGCARASTLRWFGVGSASLIQDYVRVSSCLSLLFLALRHLCHDSKESMWLEFIRMHGKFVLVREQERKMRRRRLAGAANADVSAST